MSTQLSNIIERAAELEPHAVTYKDLRYHVDDNVLYMFGVEYFEDYQYVGDYGSELVHKGAVEYGCLALGLPYLDVDLIVGHSLGGMGAQIVGNFMKKEVISIGSPPIYREKSGHGRNHIRIVHKADPYRKILHGFHHNQRELIVLGSSWWEWFTHFWQPTYFHRLTTYAKCCLTSD